MSSNAAINSNLLNEIADITECSICTGVFQEPRCLPCAHTFCLSCLEVYGKGIKPSGKALCPTCRKKFTMPAGGWKNLPRNYIVEKLLSTNPGKAVVQNSAREEAVSSADKLSNSVTLQMSQCQQLADQLKGRKEYLSHRSEDVKQSILKRSDEVKNLVDAHAESLLCTVDSVLKSAVEKLAVDQTAMETRCSDLKDLQTKLEETAAGSDAKDRLNAIAVELKPLMSEAKCDSLVADLVFSEARLPDVNLVGSVEPCNNSKSTICPKLLHILNPSDNIDAVIGLGIIDDIIYVVRSWTSNIELYGAVSLKPMKAIQVLTLDLPHDMVSCAHQKCLYLSDYGSDIHRIEVSGYRMQTKWSAGSRPTGLSITIGAANVMVTYEYSQKVREYTTRGELLRETSLPNDIINPHQTLLLSSSQVLVCHGFESDSVNRVCLLDPAAMKVIQAIGAAVGDEASGQTQYQLTQPIRIAVSEAQGIMYVADFKNDRVLAVSLASLSVQCVLMEGCIRRPYRICIDDGGLLYVGSWETGQVLVYNTCCQ